MNFELIDFWVWPALLLAFFIGFKAACWYFKHERFNRPNKVNQDYFKGLNFLLNEQPDKAIEVFIQALEVDSETVELHLALGGLFRRKGQVDRATRIHQNLIARPSLTEQQRLHAICELAHDYYKAGLFDRAENLYLELKGSTYYRTQAIEGLSSIYQKEKEWQKAIDIMRLYKRSERATFARKVSHYWCELAQQSIDQQDYEEARKYLRCAANEDRSSARVILLRGLVFFRQADYRQAIELWNGLTVSNDRLTELVVADTIVCYQKLEDLKGLKIFLRDLISIPKDHDAFNVWLNALTDAIGEGQAIEKLVAHAHNDGLNGPVSSYLYETVDKQSISFKQEKVLLKDLLNRAKSSNIEYTCIGCGFETKAMYWHCPNCDQWDSFC